MNIDFSDQIKNLKEKDVLNKPFPVADGGYALFAKNEKGSFVKMLFSDQDHIKQYLNNAGYDWGNERKDEFRNFDCLNRLLTVMPELSEVETIAADPQWDPDAKPETLHEKENLNDSARKMEDMPDAVKLRKVDHPIHLNEGNHNAEDSDCKSKPSYSELWKKVKGMSGKPWLYGFEAGDKVRNINEQCLHYKSEGTVKEVKDLPDDAGFVVGYACSNAGHNWAEGDLLFKTPDQLEKLDETGAPCGPGGCFY